MTDKIFRNHDSTIARIAGNLLSGLRDPSDPKNLLSVEDERAVEWAVAMARAILAEAQRTGGHE